MLEQERQYFNEHLSEWLLTHHHQFSLIRGGELIGMYPTQEQALAEGARRFGLSSFLVRQIEESQPEVTAPALTLGLINAHP